MISIKEKKNCCGCTACYSVCPVKAITMIEDEEGFKYPFVRLDDCIDCGLCEHICPILEPVKSDMHYGQVFAGQNTNIQDRNQSTAGGFFSIIADHIIQGGGYVCAAGWSKEQYVFVNHKLINDRALLEDMRGSKYVQSELGNMFDEINKIIKQGYRCLFVGTPCQVNGLRKVIGFNPLLITIDLLCLGVSSPLIFEKWISYVEEKYKSQVVKVNFRDKSFGYNTANVRIDLSNGLKLEQCYDAKSYLRTFFHGYNMRPSCYSCQYRNSRRVSDFTIGDYHQIGNLKKEMDDDMGTTIIYINSSAGAELFDKTKDRLEYCLVKESYNGVTGNIRKLTNIPNDRERFFDDVSNMDYRLLIQKWEPNTIKDSMINIIKITINKTPLRKIVFKAIKRRKERKFAQRVKKANLN